MKEKMLSEEDIDEVRRILLLGLSRADARDKEEAPCNDTETSERTAA